MVNLTVFSRFLDELRIFDKHLDNTISELFHEAYELSVHTSGLDSRGIRENDEVVFNIQKGERGLSAINVKLA